MKSVFAYIDYRLFLRDYYHERKNSWPHFSYRWFSRKAGIRSPSFLKHVIDGGRNLTPAAVEKFIAALKLRLREATYFRHLVLFNQARTAAEKQEQYAVLRSMAGTIRETVLKAAQYDYFSRWYTVVIRELVCLHDFRDDWKALGRAVRPAVTAAQARRAVSMLLETGLLARSDNGTYRQTDTALAADDSITSMAVRSFTEKMLAHAAAALHAVPREERHISGMTVGVSRVVFDVINAEIAAFKDRIKTIVNHDDAASRVYQLNVSFFPVSTETGSSDAGEGR